MLLSWADQYFDCSKLSGEKFVADSMGLLNTATSADEALSTADLVVEAVTENMALKQVCIYVHNFNLDIVMLQWYVPLLFKQKLFTAFDAVAPAKTIFASNTSSLPIAEIAQVTPDRLDRSVIPCHINISSA